jgi:hypothetical protein
MNKTISSDAEETSSVSPNHAFNSEEALVMKEKDVSISINEIPDAENVEGYIYKVLIDFLKDFDDSKERSDVSKFLLQLVGLKDIYNPSEEQLSNIFLNVLESLSKELDYWAKIEHKKPSTYDDKIPYSFRIFLTHYLYPCVEYDLGIYSPPPFSLKAKVDDVLYPHKSKKKSVIDQAWINAYNSHQHLALQRVKEKNSSGYTLSSEELELIQSMKDYVNNRSAIKL